MTGDPLIDTCVQLLAGKLKVAVIEDHKRAQKMFKAMLCSPLLDITMAATLADARRQIGRDSRSWSCWVVDVQLPDGSGIDLLKEFPLFPFKVVMSGLQSMQTAFEATLHGGARAVFDKGAADIAETAVYSIGNIATLGFLLKGMCPDQADVFFALTKHDIRSVNGWVDSTTLERRRLEQLCQKFVSFSPLQTLTAYHALSYALGATGIDQGVHQYKDKGVREFGRACLQQMVDEWDVVYRRILPEGSNPV